MLWSGTVVVYPTQEEIFYVSWKYVLMSSHQQVFMEGVFIIGDEERGAFLEPSTKNGECSQVAECRFASFHRKE
jgi:hypothetical protein